MLLHTKTDSVSPGAPLGTYRYVIETPCTLARLAQEIKRLGGETPVGIGAAAGVSSATEEIPPVLHAATPPAAAPVFQKSHAKFMSAWTIWAFIPWLMWIAWIHAGLRTRRSLHFCFAIPYAIPLLLMIAVSAEHPQPPDWLLAIQGVCWIGCIVHVFVLRKSVNACIAERLASSGSGN
jgi:hypothetical protein